jgi:hypothetical protein
MRRERLFPRRLLLLDVNVKVGIATLLLAHNFHRYLAGDKRHQSSCPSITAAAAAAAAAAAFYSSSVGQCNAKETTKFRMPTKSN